MLKVIVVNTYSESYFRKACSIYNENEMKYKIKIEDINSRNGYFGLNKATMPTYSPNEKNKYKIYVSKSSYETAKALLRKINETEE